MNNQRTGSTLLRRLFEFVCPAAVVRHGSPAEFRLILQLWIVDQNYDDFTLHIGLEVVPLVLGSRHAITTKDKIALYWNAVFFKSRPRHELIAVLQHAVAFFSCYLHVRRCRRNADHWHSLKLSG